jgi:hypothetical protein
MPRPRLRLRLPLGPLPLRRRRRHEDPSVDRHNWRVNRHDAVAVGIVSAAGSFLAVFVARLGGSAFEVSLLTSRIRTLATLVRSEPAFVRFTLRELLFVSGTLLVLPLIPLYYVRVVDAPDAWIGIIASTQTVSLLLGYHVWRRRSAKVGGRSVLLLALPGLALVPTVLSFAHQLPVVAAAAGLGGFFTAGVDLVLFDELMRTVPRRSAVALASVHAASINGVSVVAPLMGAWLASSIAIEGALRMGTVFSLLGFGLFALDLLRRPRPAPA